MNYHAVWFDIVALVDEVCARGRASNQALLLTVLLCQLKLNLLNFTLQGLYLALTLVKLLLLRLNHFFLCSELLFLALYLLFFPLGVLEVAFEGALSQSHADMRQVKQVFDVGAICGLHLEHPPDHTHELLGVPARHTLKGALFDLQCQGQLVGCHEGRVQGG